MITYSWFLLYNFSYYNIDVMNMAERAEDIDY